MNPNKYFNSFENFLRHLKTLNSLYFNIISINVRSISSINKFNQFKTVIASFPILPNVIAIQETWFQKNISHIYQIPGYNCVHCCRYDGFGGTSVFIRSNLQYCIETCESKTFCDVVALSLENYKVDGRPIKIISFYRSQKCNLNNFYEVMENLLQKFGRSSCIFVGDSNVDFLHNGSADLLNLLESYDFKNCHTFITRPLSGKSIDNIYSNISNFVCVDAVEFKISDHNMISCRVKKKISKPLLHRKYSENL